MSAERPRLYFDLGSPYAYLAVARAEAVLGTAPELEPILLGAIFPLRGSGSWSQTDEREGRMADIESRAQRYGLPPIVWPAGWPVNGLAAMRAATWAKRQGRTHEFALAVFDQEFVHGRDISEPATLRGAALEAGLDPEQLADAITSPELRSSSARPPTRRGRPGSAAFPRCGSAPPSTTETISSSWPLRPADERRLS